MLKKCLSRLISTAMVIFLAGPVLAEQQIGWPDLTVPINSREDPYFGLEFEQRLVLEELFSIEIARENKLSASGSNEREIELVAELTEAGLDAGVLIAKDKAFRQKIALQGSSLRSEWDGVDIKIPGYMLPLEFDSERITEFLLVPYAGACIHTPPPPANQIIHVKSETGIQSMGLFTPVWVSGKLVIQRKQRSINLSDGASDFEVGYTLESTRVVEYSQ